MTDKPLIKLNPEEAGELLQQYDGQIVALKQWQKEALPYLKSFHKVLITDNYPMEADSVQSLINRGGE